MKKLLSLLLITFTVLSTAQATDSLNRDYGRDYGRGYERALDREHRRDRRDIYRPGPGDRRHEHDRYSDIYGPARTARWQDMGSFRAEKLLVKNISLDVRGQYVNEILIDVQKNNVKINSAVAYLTNGQVVELRSLLGVAREGRRIAARLDYRNSLRIDRIEMTIETAGLFGSRGSVQIQLGIAY